MRSIFFSSIKKKWQLTQARNMCIIFSLVPSKKLRKTKFLLFNFWMIEFTVIPKKAIGHLTIWQNWCLGQFYHSKTWKVNNYVACFSFLWWKGFFWENDRKYFTHIPVLRFHRSLHHELKNFKRTFWFHQKINEVLLRISALVSKKRDQKNNGTSYWFEHFLEARAEILDTKKSFWN